jgi:hypothetical protein
MSALAVITDLPEGPTGFVLFMSAVIVLGLIVMAIHPTWDWVRRRRAEDARSRGQVESMEENEELLAR